MCSFNFEKKSGFEKYTYLLGKDFKNESFENI